MTGCTSMSTYRPETYGNVNYDNRDRLTETQRRIIYRDRSEHYDAYETQSEFVSLIQQLLSAIGTAKVYFRH